MSSYSDSEVASHIKIKFKAKDKRKSANDVLTKGSYLKVVRPTNCSKTEQKFHKLVSLNNTEGVQRYLENGINPNCQDPLNRTALHIATSRSYTDMVKILLDYGADPNLQDILLNAPLHLAACNNNIAVIKLLISAGANLRSLNLNDKNPIQIAEGKLRIMGQYIQSGNYEVVKIKEEVHEIVEMMISMWHNKDTSMWGHHRNNVDDLETIKLSLTESNQSQKIDEQINKLLMELTQFSI